MKKHEFYFTDLKDQTFKVSAGITERNGYPEFTMSANHKHGGGQCYDSIVPVDDDQRELVAFWKHWHMNGANPGVPEQQELLNSEPFKEWRERMKGKTVRGKSMDDDYHAKVEFLLVAGKLVCKDPKTGKDFRYGSSWFKRTLPGNFWEEMYMPLAERVSRTYKIEEHQTLEQWLSSKGITVAIDYSKFDSMPWDKDGQKRNIFDITISNSEFTYKTQYGSSVVDSCRQDLAINADIKETYQLGHYVQDQEKKVIYRVSCKLTHEQLRDLYNDKVTIDDLIDMRDLEKQRDESFKEYMNQKNVPKYLLKSRVRIADQYDVGTLVGSIHRRAKKEIDRLIKQKEYVNEQNEIVTPSVASIMESLQPSYFEDFADFCEQFGYPLTNAAEIREAQRTYDAVVECNEAMAKLFTDEDIEEMFDIIAIG